MQELRKFGFIVKGPGYTREVHCASLDSGSFATWVAGVSNVRDATAAVAEMVSRGVQLIELCGGFSPEEQAVLQRVSDEIPIGCVSYSAAQQEKLRALFVPTPEN